MLPFLKLMPGFIRPKLLDGWLSVIFAAGRLEFVHVRRRTGDKPEVLLLKSESRSSDDLADMHALSKSIGLSQYRCSTLLNVGEYQLLQVELPTVPPSEMKEALRWRIKDMLDYPVESVTLDILQIPGASGSAGKAHQAMAAAADDGLLGPRMALFDEVKANLEAIDIPEVAQRNISALFEEEGRGLAMLVIDETGVTLSFTFQGELCAVRHTDITLTQLERAEGDRLQHLFERIGLETQRSLDNFDRLHGHISLSRLLISPLPSVVGLMDYLREYLSLPVGEVDLAEVLDFTMVPELTQPAIQAQYLKALGAALRD